MSRCFAAVIALLTAASGCTTNPDIRLRNAAASNGLEARRSVSSDSLRLVTFNAGLAVGFLPHAAERAEYVVDALAKQPSDVLCVQEFWLEEHWRALSDTLRPRMPFALHPPPESAGGRNACSKDQIGMVSECVNAHCTGVAARDMPACAVDHCRHLADRVAGPCLSCLSRDPMRPVHAIVSECGPRPAKKPPADTSRESYLYGGAYGTGLLSTARALDHDVLKLPSTQHPRAVLYAKLETPVASNLHVFCTHLTPGSGGYGAQKPLRNEHEQQVHALLDWVDEKTRGAEPAVILGDLNNGPTLGPAIPGRYEKHYKSLLSGRFTNPYAAGANPTCTFCSGALSGRDSRDYGILIDHILVRDVAGTKRSQRVFDAPLQVRTARGEVTTTLSDHYGMMLTIEQP